MTIGSKYKSVVNTNPGPGSHEPKLKANPEPPSIEIDQDNNRVGKP